ncbi:hypothetical protein ACVWYO_001314 [Sphingomonas sp. UYP23]
MNLNLACAAQPHTVHLMPGDTLNTLRQRWEESAPARRCGPIFIR